MESVDQLVPFMHEHAGYGYPMGATPREQFLARRANAVQLATAYHAAHAAGCVFEWEPEPDADTSYMDEAQLAAFQRGDIQAFYCVLHAPDDMDIQAALGDIHVESLSDPYCKVVEAELADEAGYC